MIDHLFFALYITSAIGAVYAIAREARRYWFRPPKDLRWALLQPLSG